MAWGGSVLRALQSRFISTSLAARFSNAEIAQIRNDLFIKERERQLSMYPRIEKIEVKHVGKTDPDSVFVMNKGFSTPYNCAMHLSEWYCTRSVLALVDGEEWDMYRPLTESCEIKFLTFKDDNPEEVNEAYWRSCAMMLGYALETAFKDEYSVKLIRAPEVPVISGAFCYDVVLDNRLDEWKPTEENLRSITKDVLKLIHKDVAFEYLEVDVKVAKEMFRHNNYKLDLIEDRASKNEKGTVVVHRCGDFVDLTEGAHIPRTSFCYQYDVTAAHNLSTEPELVRRFQGLSLPVHLRAHHTVWRRLQQRSQKLITEEAHPAARETST